MTVCCEACIAALTAAAEHAHYGLECMLVDRAPAGARLLNLV